LTQASLLRTLPPAPAIPGCWIVLVVFLLACASVSCAHRRDESHLDKRTLEAESCALLGTQKRKIVLVVDDRATNNPSLTTLSRFKEQVRALTSREAILELPSADQDPESLWRDCLAQDDASCVRIEYAGADFDMEFGNASVIRTTDTPPRYTGNIKVFLDNDIALWPWFRSREDCEYQVLLHEFGHLLGLDHCDKSSCIMGRLNGKSWMWHFFHVGLFRQSIESYCERCQGLIRKRVQECLTQAPASTSSSALLDPQ